MKHVLFCIVIFSIVLTQACKKKKDAEPEVAQTPTTTAPTVYESYSKLKAGNYWIYEFFNIDTLGNAVSQNTFDSCYVSKDTIIRGETYYKYTYFDLSSNTAFLRDSLHYIITSNGGILFSSQNFTTIFFQNATLASVGDTINKTIIKMANKDVTVTVPAGNFVTSDFQVKYIIYPNWNNGQANRYMHTRYAKNIGIITKTSQIFLSQVGTVEKRLVRYHLN